MVAFSVGVFLRRSKLSPPTFILCTEAPLPSPPLPSEGKGASVHRLPTVILKTEEDLSRVEVATNRVGVRVKKRDRREGKVLFSLPASSPPPFFISPSCKSLSFLKFNVVITRENKVPERHEDTWPALQATLILWSLLKTRLDLLGRRVWYTSSLPQYFDHRLDFSILNIISIQFYLNIYHMTIFTHAVNKNTVWLVARALLFVVV